MLPYFFPFPGKRGEWRCGESDEKYVLQPTHPLPFILVERLLPYSAKGPYFTSPPSLPLCIPPLPRGIFLFRGGEIPCGETEKKRETRLCEYITSGDGGGGPFPGVTHERCCTFSLECATKMFSQFFMHEKWNIFCEKYGLICVWVPFFVSLSSHRHTQNKLFRQKETFESPLLSPSLSLPYFNSFCCRFLRERRGEMFFLLPPPPSLLKFLTVWCGRLCCVRACLH